MKIWLQSKRFFMQILVFTISIFLILCILFTLILYVNARRSTASAILQTEQERNTDLLRQSDVYWMQLISLVASLSEITIPYEDLNRADNFWARRIFDNMLNSHLIANNYTENIDIIIDGQSISSSRIAHEKNLGDFYFFEMLTSASNEWPYLFDLKSKLGLPSNQIIITVKGYQLSKHLFTYDTKERLDYLLTKEGVILLTNHQEAFFQNVQDLLPGILTEDANNKAGTIRTYKDYYYTISEPDKYDFRILSLVPQSSYSHQYTTITLQTLLMSALLLLVALIISVWLTFRFYRPVKKTVELLLTYVPDNIHEYENEIAFIHQNIKKYVAKENNPEPIISETLSRIQNAQTAVMQYQINSHFLFNTLENIKSISVTELGMDNEIENSIFLLNNIIKEGVFQKNIFVPLSHEIYLTKCYLELMLIRFSDVAIYWEEDEALAQCQIFKFSLQPVLENCFTHAFPGNIDRQKEIHISVNRDGDDFLIVVQDNGVGFDAGSFAQVEQLLEDLEGENFTKAEHSAGYVGTGSGGYVGASSAGYVGAGSTGYVASTASHHVGIRNIHKRITDIFGQDYGIRISAAAPGTVVEIRYPVGSIAVIDVGS